MLAWGAGARLDMAGQSRPQILNLERIGDVFLNRIAALIPRDLHDLLGYLSSHRGLEQLPGVGVRAVVVDGLNVLAQTVPDMTVQVQLGMALVPTPGTSGVVGSPQTNPDSNFQILSKRLVTVAVPIAPAPPLGFRWDLIELGPDVSDFVDDSQIVDLYDVPGKKFVPTPTAQPVMKHGEGRVFITAGAAGATLPPPTPGRVPIAAILVFAGMTTITQDRIHDLRIFLSEFASRGRGDADSFIDVAELAIDRPHPATPAGVQKFSLQAEAVVRGVPCAFSTVAPLDFALARDFLDFLDRSARAKIFAASGASWLYCYMVATDDQGYRLSRSNVTSLGGIPTTGRFSHAGMLVWSDVPPSLADGGSLAPKTQLALPEALGNGLVTPGVGRAVCIGCAFYGPLSFRFPFGVRSYRGEANIVQPGGIPLILGHAVGGEVMSGGVGFSSVRAGWPAEMPQGPLSYDLQIQLTALNVIGSGRQRNFFVFEYQPGATAGDELRAIHETVVPIGIAFSQIQMHARGLAAGRVPAERGATRTGFIVFCQTVYGTATGGAGLSTTPTDHAFGLIGYRWPNGAVRA